ncbi:uncharacterized protein LOC141775267 isoform X3 [Sebastes fasciatus]|uniref:uncharacterized protein LOC141775267 isoform X3 n=1 Tax=Sebastes fasciatus TaxID=394691 RepID=UPI003D9F118E
MASETLKNALTRTLMDLERNNYLAFRTFYTEVKLRAGLHWVTFRSLMNPNPEEITDLLVATFSEDGALSVAVEILREIGCMNEADRLAMEARGPSFKPDPKGSPPSDEHIVDRYKDQLIRYVSDVEPILDELLTKMVIQQESYDKISALPTSEEKMRELLDGHLTGVGSKDIFYDLFLKTQRIERQGPRMSGSDDEPWPNFAWHESGSFNKTKVVTGCKMSPEGDWIKLEPEVNCVDAEDAPIYSLQSEAGNFECSVSGLRWVSKERVSLKYQFGSWEEHMERLETLHYIPGGPLLDVTVIAGKLDEAYLPHWICTEDDPRILGKMAVLHIDTCGDVVEQVSEVTPSHVKLSQPIFSPRGVLMRAGFRVKINCKVLIYKTNEAFLTLHVYLIPRDPALQQTIKKKESSSGYKIIQKPYPEKSLKMRDRFILTADLDSAEIYPEKLKLIYESSDPNFFEVFIENPDSHFQLTIRHESEPVWTCAIRKDDYQNTGDIQEMYDTCGDVVEQVSEATPSHVKLSQPIFSIKGVLMRVGFPVKINCKVLIYKTNKAFLTLHVYLIPRDPALQQTIKNKESSSGYKMIQKPHPEKSLKMHNRFILTADMKSAEIFPEKLKLMYEGSDPNFFEVFIENPDNHFKLTISRKTLPVWTCVIRKDDYQNTGDIQEMYDKPTNCVEQVSEVTPTHVKLSQPIRPLRGVLMRAGFPVKINCKVLIYKTNKAFLTLHVYLIPRDPALQQTIKNKELSSGYKMIQKPYPEKSLQMRNRFILTADLDSAEIFPEKLKLMYEGSDPNFFEVFIENPDSRFQLTIRHESEPVWTCAIRKDDYQNTGDIQEKYEEELARVRSKLVEKMSRELINQLLDDLLKDGVLNDGEKDSVLQENNTTADRARRLIDMVKNKGREASRKMFTHLRSRDHSLSDQLGLLSGLPV